MPRQSILKPTRLANRPRPWCVNVPAELSPTGKRQQRFFGTQREAQTLCDQLKVRRDNFGVTLATLSPARIAEAAECFELLDARGSELGLLGIVKRHLAALDERKASVTLGALFDEYGAAKAHRTPVYHRELRSAKRRFEPLADRMACDIDPKAIEGCLRRTPPAARNAMLRYLRAILNFGIKRGYLAENPVSRLEFIQRPRKEVETVPNPTIEAMLSHALTRDLELLPFLVFGFFCGIRPDGELQKLEWGDVHWHDSDPEVIIRSEVSKTRRRRFVKLSANAAHWLSAYQLAGGRTVGRVVPFTPAVLRAKRRAAFNAAAGKGARWPQQGMRHTFCSNWLALHKDVDELVLQSGHDSAGTMWKHYHRGTPREDAEAFWNIRPPETASSSTLIPFPSRVKA